MPIVAKIKSLFGGATSTGHIPPSYSWNFWQKGQNPIATGECATVHACVDAYAQVMSTCIIRHYKKNKLGGKDELINSALAETLRNPNSYQTRSDLIMNMVKALLLDGNVYCLAQRDGRGRIVSLHQMPSRSTQPYIVPDTNEVFYGLGNNPLVGDIESLIPQRDVLHIKLFTPNHPLCGVSPLVNAAMAIASNQTISAHQASFFENMARPSGIITTDQVLNPNQMKQLREAWAEQSTTINSGGTPILHAGLKWQSMSLNSQDAQLIDAFKMSIEDISRSLRVPLPLVGVYEHATFNNVEQLINLWLSSGLGFMLEHVEQAFAKFFGLPINEFMEFDTDSLLRTDFQGRIEGLSKGIQSGLYTPNEARAKEGLSSVEHGDAPYMQQQMVELGFTPAPPPAPVAPELPEPDPEEEKVIALDKIRKAMQA